MSHYTFLDKHLDDFWQQVFGKPLSETGCAGIVSAHGDKAYAYKQDWEDAGIHFYHGVMLFMLTYTKLMDSPQHESKEWVIDQYPIFKEKLPQIIISYYAIIHEPTGKITAQFQDEGDLSTELRLKDIMSDIDELPDDEKSEWKVIQYSCINDPFFRLPDNVSRGENYHF